MKGVSKSPISSLRGLDEVDCTLPIDPCDIGISGQSLEIVLVNRHVEDGGQRTKVVVDRPGCGQDGLSSDVVVVLDVGHGTGGGLSGGRDVLLYRQRGRRGRDLGDDGHRLRLGLVFFKGRLMVVHR